MGGVFNVVNLHVYHYAGNNPIRYTDPTGMYNKNEYNGFKQLTHQEKKVVLSSLSKSRILIRTANEAFKMTSDNSNGNWAGDQSDAFRHGYWMGRSTQEAGEKFTRKFGDAHEYATNPKDNPRANIAMDIHNNDVGIEIAKNNSTATPEKLAELIMEKIKNGDMLIMNKETGLLYKSNDTEYKNSLNFDDPFIRRADVSKKIADCVIQNQKKEVEK